MMKYNVFISYSHAVDGKLSPAIQAALKTFAKPWNRIRALSVFRDETSLAANPSLWPSIEKALSESEWFILLASPEAASSKWVYREVQWWLENRSIDKFMIVLTGGELVWREDLSDFDFMNTPSIPNCLEGKYPNEPKWVDMRWARDAESLSLRHSRFRHGILDLAAPVHRKTKEELDGEDVRQFKKGRRIRRGFVSAIIVSLILAITFAFVAFQQRNTAIAERNIANEQRKQAIVGRLAAESRSHIDKSIDLSLLLSIQAIKLDATPEAKSSLLSSLLVAEPLGKIMHGNTSEVLSVSYSSDGRLLSSASSNSEIFLWDTVQFQTLYAPLNGHSGSVSCAPLSPDGEVLASAGGYPIPLARGGGDGSIRLWDTANGKQLRILLEKNDIEVLCLTFSHDGNLLASGDRQGKIRLRNLKSDKEQSLEGHYGPVSSLAFDRQSKLLASASWDGTVRIWNAAKGMVLNVLKGHDGVVSSVAFSPDRDLVASGGWDKTVRMWNAITGKPNGVLEGSSDKIRNVNFSHDGKWVVSGSEDGQIRVWDIQSKKLLYILIGHEGAVTSLSFSPDGRFLASGSEDKRVFLWTVGSVGQHFNTMAEKLPSVDSVAFSPDGKYMAIGVDRKKVIKIYNMGKKVRSVETITLDSEQELPKSLAFSPDSKLLASVDQKGDIKLWHAEDGRPVGPKIAAHTGNIGNLHFSPDGKLLSLGSWNGVLNPRGIDRRIRIFDIKSSNQLPSPSDRLTDAVGNLAFSPDGKLLALGTDTGSVRLWNVQTGSDRELHGGHSDVVSSVAFSSDGLVIISGGWDGTICLWDAKSGNLIGDPSTGQLGVITDVAISPKGDIFAAAAGDGTIQLWAMQSNQPLGSPFRGSRAEKITFNARGSLLASLDNIGDLWLWDTDLDSWQKKGCEVANRNLTCREWRTYLGDLQYSKVCSDLPVPDDITNCASIGPVVIK
jgi:WD40 repeat protein